MPSQRVAATCNHAGATFKTAVVFDVNQFVRAERVHARRADECAELCFALGLTHFVINFDMALGVNLEDVEAEFGFDVYQLEDSKA